MRGTGEITRLLVAMKGGNPAAESDLLALVYRELKALARRYLRQERPDHTLQPTALVHEAYLRLKTRHPRSWKNREHFFASASIAMRRILVDYARQRAAAKRPEGKLRVEIDDALSPEQPRIEELLILDQLLTQLGNLSPRQARLIELVYFGGLTLEQAAPVLGMSERTAKRDWQAARAWLHAQLSREKQ